MPIEVIVRWTRASGDVVEFTPEEVVELSPQFSLYAARFPVVTPVDNGLPQATSGEIAGLKTTKLPLQGPAAPVPPLPPTP